MHVHLSNNKHFLNISSNYKYVAETGRFLLAGFRAQTKTKQSQQEVLLFFYCNNVSSFDFILQNDHCCGYLQTTALYFCTAIIFKLKAKTKGAMNPINPVIVFK